MPTAFFIKENQSKKIQMRFEKRELNDRAHEKLQIAKRD
jgi:hypothetical protein